MVMLGDGCFPLNASAFTPSMTMCQLFPSISNWKTPFAVAFLLGLYWRAIPAKNVSVPPAERSSGFVFTTLLTSSSFSFFSLGCIDSQLMFAIFTNLFISSFDFVVALIMAEFVASLNILFTASSSPAFSARFKTSVNIFSIPRASGSAAGTRKCPIKAPPTVSS